MTFSKYDFSPLGRSEYKKNLDFLRHTVDAEYAIPFERYFTYLNPRVLEDIVNSSDLEEGSIFEEENSSQSNERSLMEVDEVSVNQIINGLIESSSENRSHLEGFFASSELFSEYYESVEWEPEIDIKDSSELENYKLESPYKGQIEEFRRKSAINKGRELPTFIGWAGGIPAAILSGGSILGGGALLSFTGYTVSKANAKRYEIKADAIEKRVEDIMYEELSENYLKKYGEFNIEII